MGGTRKRLLSAGLAIALAGVAGGAALASQAGPSYLAVQSFAAETRGSRNVTLSATVDGDLPRLTNAFIASQLIVGIAWADLDTGTAVVATIHPTLGRDSFQRPDAWHLHTVQLTGGATTPNDFCLVAVSSTPTAGIQISGSTMTVQLRGSEMPDAGAGPIGTDDVDAAVGFTVHAGDAGCATGLGVRVRT